MLTFIVSNTPTKHGFRQHFVQIML